MRYLLAAGLQGRSTPINSAVAAGYSQANSVSVTRPESWDRGRDHPEAC